LHLNDISILMLKPYESKYDDVAITAENVEDLTGLSKKQLVALSGIDGCSKEGIVFGLSGKYPIIKTEAKNHLAEVERVFRVKTKEINNRSIKVYSPDKGTGTQIYKRQIDTAIQEGFKKILVWASGGKLENPANNGNITLAKFGFTLDKLSQKLVGNLLTQHKRHEKTLFELLSTEEGLNFWKEFGRHWVGEFDLTEGSINRKIWEEYYNNKFPLKLHSL